MNRIYTAAAVGLAVAGGVLPFAETTSQERLKVDLVIESAPVQNEILWHTNDAFISAGQFVVAGVIDKPNQNDTLYKINIAEEPLHVVSAIGFFATDEILEKAEQTAETNRLKLNQEIAQNVYKIDVKEYLYNISPDTAHEAILYLLNQGLPINSVAAIVGALMTESRLNPAEHCGIAQWDSSRARKIDIRSTDTLTEQMGKMLVEMKNVHYIDRIYNAFMKKGITVKEAIAIMHQYEREGVPGRRVPLSHNIALILTGNPQTSLAIVH